jgi:hypothetical protein
LVAGEQLVLFLVFALIAGALIWYAYVREKKRAQALEAVARRMGLQFSKTGGQELLANVGIIDAMPRGNSRRVKFVLHGNYRGLDVRIFQYVYETGSGKNRQTHRNTVAWARVPAAWPRLTIVPEHLGHKLFDALGGDDIDFESDEFSRRFWVRCPDRKFAYDVIHGRAMEFLMTPGWTRWELHGALLVLWEMNHGLDPSDIEPAFERIVGFLQLLPSFRQVPGVAIGPRPIPATIAAVAP